MTTKMLQVGDIVRINEPTKQDIEDMEFEGCGYTFKDIVGQLAVVIGVECAEHTVVQLVTCDENYKFYLDDTRRLYQSDSVYTVTSHLSLIHESPLRTRMLSPQTPKQLAGKPLPFIETHMPEAIVLDDGDTIEAGTTVDIVHVEPDCVVIQFLTASGELVGYGVHTDDIVEQYFTTF